MSSLSVDNHGSSESIDVQLGSLIPDGILLVDGAGNIVYTNKNAERLLGYRSAELTNQPVEILIPEHLRSRHEKHRENYLVHPVSRPMGFGSEFVARRKNGTLLPVEIMLTPLKSNGDRLIVAFMRDATARRNAEEALIREKERIEITLASIGDAIVTTDEEGRVTYLNPMAEKFTGWMSAEAYGRPLQQITRLINDVTRETIGIPPQLGRNAGDLQGRLAGTADQMVLVHRNGQEFPVADSVAAIQDRQGKQYGAVVVFRDVTERRRLNKQLYYQSTHDMLTRLINRREFERRLRRVLHDNSADSHAVLYLDLDQFKIVNDTCGHTAGDALLRQLALQLQTVVRKRDTLARLGGDEFGVLLEHCSQRQAERIANDLRSAVQEFQFAWGHQRFNVGVSIGLACIPDAGTTIADVLSAADSACYAAKEKGRNRVHIYQINDRDLHQRLDQMHWIPRLQSALRESRLRLYHQPVLLLSSDEKTPNYIEILLRIYEEKDGLVLPGAFIPAAERFDQMQILDRWVVKEVLSYIHDGDVEGLPCCAINISGQSLSDQDFLTFVVNEVRNFAVRPGQICFEITETAAITNLCSARRFIHTLKDLGCRFALDDFGSGLSSFAYLKNLPVDYLKIDGGFVCDLVYDRVNHAMVKAIHEIAEVMELKTIAESVENVATLEVLKTIGINFAQGYAIEKPRPLEHRSFANTRSGGESHRQSRTC